MEDWGAIEEVLLLDAVEQDGFGNWYRVHIFLVKEKKEFHISCQHLHVFTDFHCPLYLLYREDIAAHVVTKTARGMIKNDACPKSGILQVIKNLVVGWLVSRD